VPTLLKLDAGLQVQSVPKPDEKPQTFETVEAIDARPEWNAMRAVTSVESVVGQGSTEVWLRGVDTRLSPGDWLLFVGPEFDASSASERWDARRLTAVDADPANDRTRVAWSRRSPTSARPPRVRCAEHSCTAPAGVGVRPQRAVVAAMSEDFRVNYLNGADDPGEWPGFDIHFGASFGSLGSLGLAIAVAPFGSGASTVSLDNSYRRSLRRASRSSSSPGLQELYKVTR
jgi:hypothetical protein